MRRDLYVVVAYDVPDSRRRNRLARTLEGYGQRVQYSVFECRLDERRFLRLVAAVREHLEPGDAVRIYRMPRGEENVMVLGGRDMVESPKVIIV